MSADFGVTRRALKLPLQAATALPVRQTTLLGTTVDVPVSTSAAPPAVRPCTVSLNFAVDAPVSVGVAASTAVGGVESTGPPLGAVTETLKANESESLVLPAASAARTTKLWLPTVNADGTWYGREQALGAPPSTTQVNVRDASLSVKLKVGLVLVVFASPFTVGLAGGVVSTVQEFTTWVAALPARSVVSTFSV